MKSSIMTDQPKVTNDWPRTTLDQIKGIEREWIHEQIPRYYLHKFVSGRSFSVGKNEGKWAVIDRVSDLIDGKIHSTRHNCIKAFIKSRNIEHPIE